MVTVFLALALLTLLWPGKALSQKAPVRDLDRPVQVLDYGYVSSDECRKCHPQNHASWHASYHRTMTQVATPETLAIPIEQVALKLEGQTYDLRREGTGCGRRCPTLPWDASRGVSS